ncbi:hypothetical protein HDU67_000433 [Dinochytrium kinnereticum]|nr:hypothetical protein HDU67_000433 [Dinochytrium kinnereticum]
MPSLSQGPPLFQCVNATIRRLLAHPQPPILIQNISMTVHAQDRWAIVGRVAAGKTTLGEAICGNHAVLPEGAGLWRDGKFFSFLGIGEDSRSFGYSGRGAHERYASYEDPDDITLAEFLLSRPSRRLRTESVLELERQGMKNAREEVLGDGRLIELMDRLGVGEELLDLKLLRLSNGQMRRSRILKAVAVGDAGRGLVLDEPFMGLDVNGRNSLSTILHSLSLSQTITPVLLLRPQDSLPDWITHVVHLDQCRVVFNGPREEFKEVHGKKKSVFSGVGGQRTENSKEAVAEMKNVTVVSVDGRKILDGISWKVRRGERWHLVGPNGSGKTTLLSLLVGDHPQSFSNDLTLFGRPRGSGESIWDIKSRVGHVSPELHMHFVAALRRPDMNYDRKVPVSMKEVVASGLDEAGRVRVGGVPEEVKRLLEEVFGESAVEWDYTHHINI